MTWVFVLLGVAGALLLALVVYWHLIIAEGAYLGANVVSWTYDLVARRYDAIKQFSPRDEAWFVAEPLLQALDGIAHPRLLDVATGTGRVPVALLQHGFRGQIVGLDLSPGMLAQAQSKLRPYRSRVALIRQEAGRLPFGDAAFDAVTCLEALEFFPQPGEALREMVRTLTPEGILFISNRVGREARLLPGKAFPRSQFAQILAGSSLHDVRVQRWQVSYDLAVARKNTLD